MKTEKHYKLNKEVSLTENDVRMVYAIKEILSTGESAEVKRKTDGRLTVYRVRKEVANS